MRHVDILLSPLRNASGTVTNVVEAVRDVTDVVRSREEAEEAKAKYQAYVESSPAAVFVADGDGRYVDVNPAACQLLRYSRNELLALSIPDLAGQEAGDSEPNTFPRLKAEGALRHEQTLRRKDGSLVEVDLHAVALGKNRYMASCVDITERHRAQRALQDSTRQLATLMGNLPGMAYRCANLPGWPMDFVSEGSLALTGYASSELVGADQLSYEDLIDPDDRGMVWDSIQQAVSQSRRFVIEYRLRRKDGEVRWVWEQGQAVGESAEGVPILEGFISDITERKSSEEARDAMEVELRQSRKLEAIGLDSPTVLSTKTMGISRRINPCFQALKFISI